MITLRDVRPEDADKLRTWRNLPQISKYMYKDHYITAEEHEAWFCSALTDSTRWYWIISCDGDHKKGGRSGHSVPRRLNQ
jgi:RimJ/RimL family protein N-acetyltransferase